MPGTFAYTPGQMTVLPAGSGQTLSVIFFPTDATDYTIATDSTTISVDQALLLIQASNESRDVDQPNPPLTVSYNGFQNNDTPASLTALPSASTAAISSTAAGSYPIVVGGGTHILHNPTDQRYPYRGARPGDREGVTTQKVRKGKHGTTQVIVVQFSDAVQASDATNIAAYSLATLTTGKHPKVKPVALAAATYNATIHTATLVTRKPLTLNQPLQLTIAPASCWTFWVARSMAPTTDNREGTSS